MVTVSPHLPPRRNRWIRNNKFGLKLSSGAEAVDDRTEREAPLGGCPKRVLDVAIALSAIALLAPLMVMTAVLVKLTMGGPIIYAHPRVGHNGRMFHCFKFRTMVSQPDDDLIMFLARNPEAEREWRETRKLKNDPRVTFIGHLLRISSLDELPQLFNVLRGEMSCVGPRPIVTAELGRYGVHAREYLSSRPGLTGLWQVSGRSHTSYARRIALDCEYVRTWSIWLDLRILLKTISAVLSFHQAS